jgi:protein TonB
MFSLLSEESVSEIPRIDVLYVSLAIHLCALFSLTWFSLFVSPVARFELIAVHAGTAAPVRNPEPIFAPVRVAQPSTVTSAIPAAGSRPSEIPLSPGVEMKDVGQPPTVIPYSLLTLLEPDGLMDAMPNMTLSDIRVPSSFMLLDDVTVSAPPEPPPGELNVQPPPVVGGRLEPAVLITQTTPVYPAIAKTARVEGLVVLEGTVNIEGRIENIQIVSGHPMLVGAAVDAVKKWIYRPARLNGRLMACPLTVQVRFSLRYPNG